MKKLSEVVRETQEIEEGFEADAPYLLERLAAPDLAQNDLSMIKMYAHSVAALGRNCDELIEMAQSQQ